MAATLREAAKAAATAGLDLDTRLAQLRIVPEPLATRLVAQHLLDYLPQSTATADVFVTGQVALNSWPSPEELALLRRLFADNPDRDATAIVDALGPPPTPRRIEELAADAAVERPKELVRPHRWLVALPQQVAHEWRVVDTALEPHLGVASSDGVMMRVGRASFVPTLSAIAADELKRLSPGEAAARVAAWRAEPDASFTDPDAAGLAAALREVIDADPAAWLPADPVDLARTLRHPRYVVTLVDALNDYADRLPKPTTALNLAEAVITNPWDPGATPESLLDADIGWTQVVDASIKLLGRLGKLGSLTGDPAERAWALIATAVADRPAHRAPADDSELEPLAAALRLRWIQALEAALSFGSGIDDVPDPRLLALLDEVLALNGLDGLRARALLAIQWPWLRDRAPIWFVGNADRIFGDNATLDLYLQYGPVSEPILREQRSRIVEALGRAQHEAATQHLLHGMMFGIRGYEPTAVAAVLAEAGHAIVAEAARWLGIAFIETEGEIDVVPVVALWGALLDLNLPSEVYAELGWLALNDHLDDRTWLELTDRTLTAAGNDLAEPSQVAERAGRTPTDPQAASIIAKLLAGEPRSWELERIGAVGLEILAVATDASANELRERLLERGFYDARS